MNLWHDIPAGSNIPSEVNVLVEIPKGSHNKYELDKELGIIKLDRANYNASPYPCEYGYIPQTLWEDGDAVDVLLLTTYPLHPGVLVSARPIALMQMTDGGESDDKIICVPVDDVRFNAVNDLGDINPHTLKEFKHFFEVIKQLKGKPVEVTVHGFKGKEDAFAAVEKSIALYKEKFNK
jgi:inorganic pyrophosphatase